MTATMMWLCTECRRLIDGALVTDYRSEGGRPRCAYCGTEAVVDPRHGEHADVLESMDEHERLARLPRSTRLAGRAVRALGATVGIGVFAVMLTLLAFGWGRGDVVFEVLAMALAGLIAVPAGALMIRSVRRYWQLTSELPLPGRWALALPSGEPVATARGTLECSERLRSPLSGEECVAYEIGVRYDDDAEGPLGTWLLLEQRCADVELNTESLAGSNVHLKLPRQVFEHEDNDSRVDSFLRDRGIRVGRDSYVVYETRLMVGDPVVLQRYEGDTLTLAPQTALARVEAD